MKAKRKGSLIRVELHPTEVSVIVSLLHDLQSLLVSEEADDPVVRRLYPDGYSEDPDAAKEFRELVESGLRSERTARVTACQAELPADGGRMDLDPDAADRWLRVINDLRLTLGTRLGVTEEDDVDGDPVQVRLYHWLTAVQEALVQQVMR